MSFCLCVKGIGIVEGWRREGKEGERERERDGDGDEEEGG